MKDGLTVSLDDRGDRFILLSDDLSATVGCGPGNDVVVIGDVDAASDCETVLPG